MCTNNSFTLIIGAHEFGTLMTDGMYCRDAGMGQSYKMTA